MNITKEAVMDLYNKGVITKKEMFGVWKSHDIVPSDEFFQEYVEWFSSIQNGSVTACIRA